MTIKDEIAGLKNAVFIQGHWVDELVDKLVSEFKINKKNIKVEDRLKNKKKGVIFMPKEMIKDYIGKKVSITVFNNAFAFNGILESFEGNWIKVSTKKNIQIINIDHIQSIVISK